MMKSSKYHTLSSSVVFINLLKKLNLTRYVFCSAIILSIWERHIKRIGFVSYILLLISLYVLLKIVVRFYIFSLTDILLKDCDPKKFLNVMLDYYRNCSCNKHPDYISFLCAAAFFYNGNLYETDTYLKHVFSSERLKYKGLYKFILASSYYYDKKDSQKHAEIVNIFNYKLNRCKYKFLMKKEVSTIKTILKAKELALARNYPAAKELFLSLYQKSTYQFERVMFSMYLAEMEISLEEYSSAKAYLEYVRENGHNLIIVSKAKQLLSAKSSLVIP